MGVVLPCFQIRNSEFEIRKRRPFCKGAGAFFLVLFFLTSLPGRTLGDEFRVLPFIAFRQEYNDNLFFSTKGKEEDFISTLSPGMELVEKTERLDTNLVARLDWRSYLDHDDLSSWDQSYTGKARYQLHRSFQLFADASYIRDSYPDRDFMITGLAMNAVVRKRQQYSLAGEYVLLERSTANLSYAFERDDYQDPEFTDIRSHSINLGLVQDLRPIVSSTTGRMNIGYSRYRFHGAEVENLTWSLGGLYEMSEILSLLVDLGARYTRSKFEAMEIEFLPPFFFRIVTVEKEREGWGGVGQVVLSYKGELTRGDLKLYRDVRTASGRGGAMENTSFTLNVDHRFTYELTGTLSVGYYWNRSKAQEFGLREIDEETLRIRPGIRYAFSRDFFVEGSYSFGRIRYKNADAEADRNQLMVLVRYRYPLLE